MPLVEFKDLGLIDYKKAWDFQEELFQSIIEKKIRNRELSEENQIFTKNHLLFCEHPHVYTLGKNGSENNLLISGEELNRHDASYYKINRGGDITYHGPGQLVGYPILNLDYFFTDIHKYLRYLEEAVILTLAEYGIKAGRFPGYTGVWLEAESSTRARKICAMGVRCSRWVTMHGFAFNVNANLNYFNHIVPCGIKEKDVTSIQKELNMEIDIQETKSILKKHLAELFNMQFSD